jgi:hypothetical protein
MVMATLHVDTPAADASPDADERISDFLSRHGGAGTPSARDELHPSGDSGWSEIYAADGYVLRCDWSRIGNREEMQFAELPPGNRSRAN